MILGLLVLGAALAIGFVVYNYVVAQRRREALQVFAMSRRWTYRAADDRYATRWSGQPFADGTNRRARNVITGTTGGFPVVAFDYSYETESTDSDGDRSRTTHRYAVTALVMPGYLPRLSVTPESALSRVGAALGAADIELESEAFNRRFRVTCPDRKFASDALVPRTMELLLARSPLHWRMEGSEILCWEVGSHTPVQILERASTLAAVVGGIPSFVWQDHGAQPPVAARPTAQPYRSAPIPGSSTS
ncbi:MAG: hypothetical protein M3Z02_01110 [Actinomycetota bacterium]|nr:hypothetical protein [Actinomycetota bacterium]